MHEHERNGKNGISSFKEMKFFCTSSTAMPQGYSSQSLLMQKVKRLWKHNHNRHYLHVHQTVWTQPSSSSSCSSNCEHKDALQKTQKTVLTCVADQCLFCTISCKLWNKLVRTETNNCREKSHNCLKLKELIIVGSKSLEVEHKWTKIFLNIIWEGTGKKAKKKTEIF